MIRDGTTARLDRDTGRATVGPMLGILKRAVFLDSAIVRRSPGIESPV
jgi:hypothetical protein